MRLATRLRWTLGRTVSRPLPGRLTVAAAVSWPLPLLTVAALPLRLLALLICFAAGPIRVSTRTLFAFARADLGDALRERNLKPRGGSGVVVEVGQRHGRQLLADGAFDGGEVAAFVW